MARPDRSPVLFAPQPAHFSSRPLLSQSFSSPSFPTSSVLGSKSNTFSLPPPPLHSSPSLPLQDAPFSFPCSSSSAYPSPVSSASSTPPPPMALPLAAPVPISTSSQPLVLSSSFNLSPPSSSAAKPRPPKPTKKGSSSCTKVRAVQCSLEIKVERAKGFHAFFVPLARNLPPAPPSSPVAGHSARDDKNEYFVPVPINSSPVIGGGFSMMGMGGKAQIGEERWVEDVQVDDGMEIDSIQ